MSLEGRSILVTGGTGSFGQAFVAEVLRRWPGIRRLVVFSRDELKQSEMARSYPVDRFPQMRFFIGDVRDRNRLRRALEGIDTVVHAAALKQVPAAEYNPTEFIHTNIIGAENLIEACMDTGVSRVVALSTDKAAAPINLYGATKLCSDKLFVAANNFQGGRDLRFCVVRCGNVLGSRGSVVPYFLQQAKQGVLSVTNPAMTRFNIALDACIDMVVWAAANTQGGEILVAKCPSFRLGDLADAIGTGCRKEVIGLRHGEKTHENMICASDSPFIVDLGHCYAILPSLRAVSLAGAPTVPEAFTHSSLNNPEVLTIDQIRKLVCEHVDSSFVPV